MNRATEQDPPEVPLTYDVVHDFEHAIASPAVAALIDPILRAIDELAARNEHQWNLEDESRHTAASGRWEEAGRIKVLIDESNTIRTNLLNSIDYMVRELASDVGSRSQSMAEDMPTQGESRGECPSAVSTDSQHPSRAYTGASLRRFSDTAGDLVDRMTILAIRRRHVDSPAKVTMIEARYRHLHVCLLDLWASLAHGTAILPPGRVEKVYSSKREQAPMEKVLSEPFRLAAHVASVTLDILLAEGVARVSSVVAESHQKDNRDVVTDMDIRVEERLNETLVRLLPTAGFQGEESSISASDKAGLHWTVDPIDGTVNFSRGLYPFTCAALLARGSEPILAVVVDALDRSAAIAAKGEGAFLWRSTGDDSDIANQLHVEKRTWPQSLHSVMATPKLDARARADSLRLVDSLLESTTGVRILVSQAYEARSLAHGGLDSVVSLYSSGGWSSGAAKLLCREAGGIVLDIDPNEEDRKHGFALVANNEIATELVALLGSLGYSVSQVG